MARILRVVVLVVLLSLGAPVALAADAGDLRSDLSDNRAEQQEREQELAEVREQADDVRMRVRAAETRLEDARAELARREEELGAAREELAERREEAQRARRELQAAQERLEAAEAELLARKQQLEGRVRAAYKYGQVSLTEAFVGVRDFSDLVSSSTYVGHVMTADKELVDGVAGLLEEVAAQRAEAQRARVASEREERRAQRVAEEVAEAERDQRRLTERVAERRAAHETALEELQQDAGAIAEHLDALRRSEDEVRARIAEAERRARQREEQSAGAGEGPDGGGQDGGSSESGSGWLQPVDGRRTSGYGNRTHPVHGGTRLHAGVDLAAPTGTPVRASRGGFVAFAGWMSGYGNTVMVSHGDGLVTLYAHLSSTAVSEGAAVAGGDTLGGAGMSGTATGPHLHFEVRVGGEPRQPCGYIAC